MPDAPVPDRLRDERPPGPTTPAVRHALQRVEIERALIDVALLRSFVSSRNDRSLDRAWSETGFAVRAPASTPDKEGFLARIAELEAKGAAAVADDPRDIAFLFAARDVLNCAAAPADAYTIAFTGLYGGGLPEADTLIADKSFAQMLSEASSMRKVFRAIALGGILAIILAVWLSVHALMGKTVLARLAATEAEHALVADKVAEADRASQKLMGDQFGPWMPAMPRLCDRIALLPRLADPPRGPVQGFEGADHARICDVFQGVTERRDVARSELATWIDTTIGMPMRLLPGLTWRDNVKHTNYTSAQVAEGLMGALTIYYIPVMFGIVGGAVYAVRRLNQKIMDSELHPRDWRHALLRIFMAFLLGGCIGLFFTPEGIKVDGGTESATFTLSIAALAFLAGYSVEVVFRFFDALVAQALRIVQAVAPGGARP